MNYLLIPDGIAQHADTIQRRLYEMSRPEAVRGSADVTTEYSGVLTHPVTGEVALEMPGMTIPLHPENIPNRLIDFLKDVLTNQQQIQVRNYVQNNRGEHVDVLGMLASTYWPARVKTEVEMRDWFPEPL